jgi:hypothetical protein
MVTKECRLGQHSYGERLEAGSYQVRACETVAKPAERVMTSKPDLGISFWK